MEAAILAEEEDLLRRVLSRVASAGRAQTRAGFDYDAELLELRDEVAEAKPEDLPALVEQMHRMQAVAARRGRGRDLPIDAASPYFAHLRLREGGRTRDVLIGKRGFIDRAGGVQIVDWRNAPVSRIYYRYEEGDDYDEQFGDRRLEGVVEARRNVAIAGGRLRRIGCPQGTFVRDAHGVWHLAEGSLRPVLQGGQGKAARPPRRAPSGARLGVHDGPIPRADKHLPEIAALIDPDQFTLITRPSSGLVLLQGGAGSGKTTVALHRIAYLNYQDPERFRPSRMLLVVPSEALVRYVSGVLPALGVQGVPVSTYRSWARGLRRKLIPALGDRYNEDTPDEVALAKKHPALLRLIERRMAAEIQEVGRALAVELESVPGRAVVLAAWEATEGEPIVRRLSQALARCEKEARLADPIVRRLRRRASDVVAAWSELLTNEASLAEAFAREAPGELRPGQIRRVVEWCSAQLDTSQAEEYEGLDDERRQTVDGRRLGEEDEQGPQGRLDPEDDALLLWIYHCKHGRLAPSEDKRPNTVSTNRASNARWGEARPAPPDEGGRERPPLMGSRASSTALEYAHLAIDEAQDLAAVDLKLLLRCTTPERSVTIAGDAAQRLVFDNAFSDFAVLLREAGCAADEAVDLRLSYRSTAEVMRFARDVLGPLADPRAPLVARSGAPIALHRFEELGEAVAFLSEELRSLMGREPTASVALIARHPEQADLWHGALAGAEVPALRRVRRHDFSFAPGIDVTDVAQVKGLEFDYVVLLDATESSYPATAESRHLLHIGATRAAHQLWLISSGKPSPLLPEWLSTDEGAELAAAAERTDGAA